MTAGRDPPQRVPSDCDGNWRPLPFLEPDAIGVEGRAVFHVVREGRYDDSELLLQQVLFHLVDDAGAGDDLVLAGVEVVEDQVERAFGIFGVQDGAGIIASEGVRSGVVGVDEGGEDQCYRERDTRTVHDLAATGAVTGPGFCGFFADGARKDGYGHNLGIGGGGYHGNGWPGREKGAGMHIEGSDIGGAWQQMVRPPVPIRPSPRALQILALSEKKR